MGVKVDVLKAKSSQTYLIGHGERVSMDPELAINNGVVVGQQIRVRSRDYSDRYAAYTVHQFMQDGTDNNDVRMAYDGRQRMGFSSSFKGWLEGTDVVALQGKTEQWLNDNNEFGEFLDESSTDHTKLVACAPHGGIIENYTDEEAERVYANLDALGKDVSSWRCKGWQDELGAYAAWHITSTEIHRASFPLLNSIGDRGFDYAVSFHGYSEDDIAVGGGAPVALKQDVADAIAAIPGLPYDVTVLTGGEYSGTSPDNFVNWLTTAGNGIQIEQPFGARRDYWQQIADAVAGVFASLI